MKTCAICQQNKSVTFTLDIPVDTVDDDEKLSYPATVCEQCWDIIATVALRRLRSHIDDIFGLEVRLRKLEVFTGMVAPAPETAPAPVFHAGDAGYSDGPENPQVDEDGALRF